MTEPLGWIAVTDQMPMLGQRVMLGNASNQWVTIGARAVTGTYMHWDDDDGEELHEPTHWMPVPEPPKTVQPVERDRTRKINSRERRRRRT